MVAGSLDWDGALLRMLVMGGQDAARGHIARTIGRRGRVCVESFGSVDSGLAVLEWRHCDLLGIFLGTGEAPRVVESPVLRAAKVQLVLFGRGLSEEIARVRRRLQPRHLPPPIFMRSNMDLCDEAQFWRSLAERRLLSCVPKGSSATPQA